MTLSFPSSVCVLQVPVIAIAGSGGGFRAMVGFSGVMKALFESGVLDCATYIAGLSGSTWSVFISPLSLHLLFPWPLLFLKTLSLFFLSLLLLPCFFCPFFLSDSSVLPPPFSGKLSCLPLLVWSCHQASISGLFQSPSSCLSNDLLDLTSLQVQYMNDIF